jgi:hypothetical protein
MNFWDLLDAVVAGPCPAAALEAATAAAARDPATAERAAGLVSLLLKERGREGDRARARARARERREPERENESEKSRE